MTEKFTYTESELHELLSGIAAGTISEYAIPESLYLKIADYLKSGLYQGFGGSLADFSGVDLELLTELRENTYLFSAAKSYHELKEIRSLMFDESGNLRSNREFNKLAAQTFLPIRIFIAFSVLQNNHLPARNRMAYQPNLLANPNPA